MIGVVAVLGGLDFAYAGVQVAWQRRSIRQPVGGGIVIWFVVSIINVGGVTG